jgi:1,4-alpha-glucan branching enzyme
LPYQLIKFLLGSHDQIGCRRNGGHNHDTNMSHRHGVDKLGGRQDWDARARARMWYAMQCTSQGIPMAFMVRDPFALVYFFLLSLDFSSNFVSLSSHFHV